MLFDSGLSSRCLRAFGLWIALSFAAGPLSASLGADVPLGGNNEPAVAVDPNNSMHVAYASLHELRVSTDGGATFQPPVRPLHPGDLYPGGADPSVAYDCEGRLFWAYLGFYGHQIIAQCDPETGQILDGYPVDVADTVPLIRFDKGWLTIDCAPGSPFTNRLYLAWSSNQRVYTSYSADQGLTWSAPVGSPEVYNWPAHNAVAPNGDVYLAYHHHPIFPPDGTTGSVYISRSTDGGVTYQNPVLAFQPGDADITNNYPNHSPFPGTRFHTQGSWQPWVLPDPNIPGRVSVVACDDPDNQHGVGDDADIFIATSTDYGLTWSAPTRVDDGPYGTFQLFPTATIERQTGTIAVHYYDNRRSNTNADGNYLLDVFTNFSLDGGVTFSPGVQVNDAPFDPDLSSPCRRSCAPYLISTWGFSANDVYIVGFNGAILHYDGFEWSYQVSGTSENFWGVWGSSPNDVFAVGENGTIQHFDGQSWQGQSSGTVQLLRGVGGTGPDNVFAVGEGGTILHYDGNAWSPQTSGTSGPLCDVWASGPNDIWAVAVEGDNILHYDGSWSPQAIPSPVGDFGRAWGSSANDVFVLGSEGAILHYDGQSWSTQYSQPGRFFSGVWGSSGSDVFAVDYLGGILHYDGNAWTDAGSVRYGWEPWGSSGADVFVPNDWGKIYHYDGVAWSEHHDLTPSTATLRIGEYNGIGIVQDSPDAFDILAVWCGNKYNNSGYPIAQQTFFDRFRLTTSGIALDTAALPSSHALLGRNHPNPFRTQTSIEFVVPTEDRVALRIVDTSGRVVRQLLDTQLSASTYRIDWDGRDGRGRVVASGVYWYQLGVGGRTDARRLIIVR